MQGGWKTSTDRAEFSLIMKLHNRPSTEFDGLPLLGNCHIPCRTKKLVIGIQKQNTDYIRDWAWHGQTHPGPNWLAFLGTERICVHFPGPGSENLGDAY